MRRAAFPLSLVGLAVLLFATWMHPSVLWPGNAGWLLIGEDRGQTALGLAASLRAGSGLYQPLLSAPEGLPLLFTDSVPLLGILLWPLTPLLPAQGQFVGIWYLLCIALQLLFAALLVRPQVADPVAAWCGVALLAGLPVLFNRYGHPSLCAQWLLLWSLWIYLDPRRASRPLWWAAVLAVAALVHSYLLLMVAAFWGSAILWQVAREDWRRVPMQLLAIVAAVTLLAFNGVFDGPYASTHSYGQFPAALDAWWNPANPGYTALPFSSPAMPQGRGFEGFNYLGAGVLALSVVALLLLLRKPLATPGGEALRRVAGLIPALTVLALLAIGPAPVWRGEVLFALPLPAELVDMLDPVRAGGRLLWPATYVLTFAVIVRAGTLGRAPLILAAALALQVADLAPMLSAVRTTSARADDPRTLTRTADPRWTALIGRAADVQFEPAEPSRDLQLVQEVSWRAIAACRPVRSTYSARVPLATRRRFAADTRAFRAGRLAPTRLYILLGEAPAPATVAGRVQIIDGVRVIAPQKPARGVTCP